MAEIRSDSPDYDPYNPHYLSKDQGLESYLSAESSFRAKDYFAYVRNTVGRKWRFRALLVIFKYSKCENFDPITPYLALNYFDRVITTANIPEVQPDLQVLTGKQFLDMEIHILVKLEWNMRSVTALCFLKYFEPKLDPTCGVHRKAISEIIIQSQNDFKIPKYKPSVIAAAALIAASSYLYPQQSSNFKEKLVSEDIIVKIHLFVDGMIKMCEQLQLFPKIGVVENEHTVQATDEKSGQVADEMQSKGTEKALEMTEEIQKLTEYSKHVKLEFPLRWRLGVDYEQKFVIFDRPFQFIVPDPAKEAAQAQPAEIVPADPV
ncbi:Cyclin [Parasponia andersonii]|uniref:Cyclin n=1 Tax=Parasponia andersonii TaxID=3476 RepID=A0A2P5AP54_PARAD|nr:Cyclin [Parasponia andersonii]